MPSRSVLNTATPPDTNAGATSRNDLPAGLTVAPTPPGISPLSGLPLAQLPTVSPGTAPVGPEIHAGTARAVVSAPSEANTSSQSRTAGPTTVAPHPQANPRTALGTAVHVSTPPPPAPPEAPPPSATNEAGETWVAGHHTWVDGQWQWTSGSWQRPPNPGATWVPGHYDPATRRWTEGHWNSSGNPARR